MTSAQIVYISAGAAVLIVLALLRYIYKKSFMLQTPMPKQPLPCQPDDFHLAYQNVMFNASDGTPIKGWFIPSLDEDASETVIMCHGRGSNKGRMLERTHFLAEKYNLLYFDFRACGESGGTQSTIGYLETRDFDAAYKFLKDNREGYADKVAIFGSSVGGSVAIYAAAKYPEISGVITESVFLSLKTVVRNWCRHNMKLSMPFVPLTLAFSRRSLKADPEQFSPISNASAMRCPILFIHGENDRLVPEQEREELFRICGSPRKEKFIVSGATHTKCAETGGILYREKISEFLSSILQKEKRTPAKEEGTEAEITNSTSIHAEAQRKNKKKRKK